MHAQYETQLAQVVDQAPLDQAQGRAESKTVWPVGLMQDDCKQLSRWFASRPGARAVVRENSSLLVAGEPDAASRTQPSSELSLCTRFFTEIGLPWRWRVGASGFLKGVEIVAGGLVIDPDADASTVLHEAGHIACFPGEFRALANGCLSGVWRAMMEATAEMDPDTQLVRAVTQCTDPEATAWAWAAGVHIGLSPDRIIQDAEYEGEGAGMRLMLQMRGYFGINGLAHAGFCATRPGLLAAHLGLPAYPKLARWLQRDFRAEVSAARANGAHPC